MKVLLRGEIQVFAKYDAAYSSEYTNLQPNPPSQGRMVFRLRL